MTAEQVQAAKGAGASFIISPNVSRAVIEKTVALDMVSMPGAMTPTEIADAHDYGADLVKVFPASILGAAYVKAVRAPLEHIDTNGKGYLRCAAVKQMEADNEKSNYFWRDYDAPEPRGLSAVRSGGQV